MAGEFVPHCELVKDEGATPERWVLVLHGIFGSGKNWRSISRRLVGRRPEWGVGLVDLRMHGESTGAVGPHTVAAAGGDVCALAAELARQGKRVAGVIGHSFGGKVALRYAADCPEPPAQVWVLDSDPAPKPDAMAGKARPTTVGVLEALEQMSGQFESRKEFVGQLAERGFDRAIGQWLAMNLVEGEEGYRMRLDPIAMRSLLASFFATDAWPAVEAVSERCELRFVLGGDSTAVSAVSAQRLRTMRVIVHEIVAAGHWLHVDAPDALLDLIARELPGAQ